MSVGVFEMTAMPPIISSRRHRAVGARTRKALQVRSPNAAVHAFTAGRVTAPGEIVPDNRIQLMPVRKIHADLADVIHLEPADRVAYVDGDFECDRIDLEYDAFAKTYGQKNSSGLVVSGDLKVNGAIINHDKDDGPRLMVGGSLTCNDVVLSGAIVVVQEQLTVLNTLVGVYNHGKLVCAGDARIGFLCSMELSAQFLGTLRARLIIAKSKQLEAPKRESSSFYRVHQENTVDDRAALQLLDPRLLLPDTHLSGVPNLDLLIQWAEAGRPPWATP